MTIIQLYNDKARIDCAPEEGKTSQQVANEILAKYADTGDENYQNLQQREVEITIPTQIVVPIPLPLNWLGLEQSLYTSALFAKGLQSQGNGFALLLAVLGNGKRGESSENALQIAIGVTLQGLSGSNALTAEEVTALNTVLAENNFTIQI